MANNCDLSSIIVQEIAASLTDQKVPDRYIREETYSPAEEEITDDLLVDFSSLSSEDEVQKLQYALSTWGCFQLVNLGMETEFLEKVLDVSKQFFALPLEEKKKSYGSAGRYSGYGNDGMLWRNYAQNWNDRLYLRVSKNPADLDLWPENPSEFRKIVGELASKIQATPEVILKAMARSVELEEDGFLKYLGLDGGFLMKTGFYPPCPNPDRVYGFAPHSDATLFTMLLPNNEGLEIKANDRWFKVPIIPGALLFIVGDLMEIMSNGAIKSTVHRVVASSEKERISVGMFYIASAFKDIGPVDELVTADRPLMYKKTDAISYAQMHHEFTPTGKSALLAFRV